VASLDKGRFLQFHGSVRLPNTSSLPRIGQAIEQARRLAAQQLDWRVDLAVTGLSGAGKTVFITSLIQNLLASVRDPLALESFVAHERSLVGAEERPAGASEFELFPTMENLRVLAGERPAWPTPTSAVRRTELALRYRRRGLLRRVSETSVLTVGITDYPGEWLLDLPLLEEDWSSWSRRTLALLREPPRAALAAEFLAFVDRLPADAVANEAVAREGHELYRACLLRCRNEAKLSMLQPGRFVQPDGQGDRPLLWFFPAPLEATGVADKLATLLALRFDQYCRKVVEPFFRATFGRTNRQVVLVDLLSALHDGPHAFDDLGHALGSTMAALGVRRGGLLGALLPRRFDRVLFAATKADYLPGSERANLAGLLDAMLGRAQLAAKTANATTRSMVLASVRATIDERVRANSTDVDVVVGTTMSEGKRVKFWAGRIPRNPPRASDWTVERVTFPRFQPPPISTAVGTRIPHINMDAAARFLLADLLR
jgi:predicted YcjX-like family ATPase